MRSMGKNPKGYLWAGTYGVFKKKLFQPPGDIINGWAD
jgi:hypothetical protein